MNKYTLINLTETEVIYRVKSSVEVEGLTYYREETFNLNNNLENTNYLMSLTDLPKTILNAILTRWCSDKIINISVEEIANNSMLLFAISSNELATYDANTHQYQVNDLFEYFGIKYKVIKPFISSADFQPYTIGAREFVLPFQGVEDARWAYMEEIPFTGIKREYENNYYTSLSPVQSNENKSTPDKSNFFKLV